MPEPSPVPDTPPSRRSPRPPPVAWSAALLSGTILLSIWYAYVTTVASVGELISPSIWAVIIGITLAVGAFQVQQVFVGRNYMRVFTAIGTVLSLISLAGVGDAVYWLMNVMLAVATVLLFVPSANRWFREVAEERAKRKGR